MSTFCLNFLPTHRYLCKLTDKELRRTSARDMAEMMWSAIKEPMEAPLSFDKDSLELAYKYFVSSTLTMRLTGLSQITVRRRFSSFITKSGKNAKNKICLQFLGSFARKGPKYKSKC